MLTSLISFLAKKLGKRIVINDRFTNKPYLVRYILLSNKWCSLYVHRFLSSDKGNHHDHPWNFYTWVISKGYKEERLVQDLNTVKGDYVDQTVYRKPGSIAYRKAEDLHRVIIDRDYDLNEENVAPLTVCFLGKRRRVWGFAHTKNDKMVWENWVDYLGLDEQEVKEALKGRAV